MRLRKVRNFFGYLVAGAVMLVFFLYLRFPGDAAKNWLKSYGMGRLPDLVFVIDAVEPSFPPGVKIKNITAAFRQRPEATIHADNLAVSPGWLSLLRGRVCVLAEASAYDGNLHVRNEFTRTFSLDGPFSTVVKFNGLRLDKCLWFQNALSRRLWGTLNGSLTFNGSAAGWRSGTGKTAAVLSNGGLVLTEKLLGFDRIDFSRADLKMELRDKALKIAELKINGDKLSITLKGNILLADDFTKSRLELNGFAAIQGLGGRRVPITIGGEIGRPKVKAT